ncbi:MAG: pilus assembly protein [Arachnia sp.]
MRIPGRHDERGALAVWTSLALVAFIVLIGLGIDFAGHAAAEQEARQVAAQAARAGGQAADFTGEGHIGLAGQAAIVEANRYASASGYSATVRVDAQRVHVEIDDRYTCVFLTIIGIGTLPVHAEATAEQVAVLNGGRR